MHQFKIIQNYTLTCISKYSLEKLLKPPVENYQPFHSDRLMAHKNPGYENIATSNNNMPYNKFSRTSQTSRVVTNDTYSLVRTFLFRVQFSRGPKRDFIT